MQRFVLSQKWMSIGGDYKVKDQDGRVAFVFDGHAFSLGRKLTLEDGNGNEVAVIAEKLISLAPAFEVERNGKVIAVIKKSLFNFFRCTFTVDVPGPDDLTAKGDFLDHEYEIELDGKTIASVSKKWFTITDAYGIEVRDGVDPVLVLSAAVVIDLCCHEHEGESH